MSVLLNLLERWRSVSSFLELGAWFAFVDPGADSRDLSRSLEPGTTSKVDRPRALKLVAGLSVDLVALASAADPDPRPASFFGTVTVDGLPAPNRTRVTAALGGTEFAAGLTLTDDGNWVYRLDVPGDIATTPAVEGGVHGETVAIYVECFETPQSSVWSESVHIRTDLSATAGADLRLANDDDIDAMSPGQILSYTLTATNDERKRSSAYSARDRLGLGAGGSAPPGTEWGVEKS